jgi:hypothetical protein
MASLLTAADWMEAFHLAMPGCRCWLWPRQDSKTGLGSGEHMLACALLRRAPAGVSSTGLSLRELALVLGIQDLQYLALMSAGVRVLRRASGSDSISGICVGDWCWVMRVSAICEIARGRQ